MSLPEHISVAATVGDLETIRAYFEDDSARDVNESDGIIGMTPLMRCAGGISGEEGGLTPGHVEVARYLLSRGASTEVRNAIGNTVLLRACYRYRGRGTVGEMIQLLLSAGADPNARNELERTVLSALVKYGRSPSVECVTALLRAGASIDRVYKEHPLEHHFPDSDEPDIDGRDIDRSFWPAVRALAAGVRRNGSFKRYLREPHREVLLLRGLAMRGHLMPRRRTRGTAEWTAAVAFLARLGDNGVVWNVLSFWRAAN